MDKNKLREYMLYCFDLAIRGRDTGVKYPLVGALVISPSGEIVGEGNKILIEGTKMTMHAERMAISSADFRARDSTLITTLEPCYQSNSGKGTLFECCTELILKGNIKKVVFGFYDSRMTGDGLRFLERRGIQVERYSEFDESPVAAQLGRNYRSFRNEPGKEELFSGGLVLETPERRQ
jgi:pyrimidine deaminase RibD-like protein